MADPVEIHRDTDGVPHVRAATVAGAFRGQGYAAAQDRLWQMEMDRRRATGRLAEVVGPTAVASDTFHRRMGLTRSAQDSWRVLRADTRAMLAAYADGVNQFLASSPVLPGEFELLEHSPEPWEPWHSVALYQVRHLAMGTFENKVWRSGLLRNLGLYPVARLWPSVPDVVIDPDSDVVRLAATVDQAMAASAAAVASFGDGAASNNLVLAGTRTATGRPILAGDPHRAIDLPNVYWQNHLSCSDPDGFDVIGLSFPGVPGFPHFGHNPHVAWCITHGMADDQDVFVVPVAGEEHTETIQVRGADPVDVRCVATDRGPIVASHGDTGLALAWTASAAPDTTFDSLLPMLRAGTVDDLDAALVPWVVPVNNLLMADTAGAVAYRMRGRLAVRPADNGWTVVSGDEPDRAWAGFVADADLPRWRDPDRGFLVTANNRVEADGPYVSHDWAHPARATTLTRRLSARDDWSVAAVAGLLCDTYSPVAEALAGRLRSLRPHPHVTRALAQLDGWDHHMDADSAAAAVVGTTRAELVGLVSEHLGLTDDRLPGVAGPTLHSTLRMINARIAFWVDDRELVPDSLLAAALRIAVRSLELTFGGDPATWRWGAVHTARFVHPLEVFRPDLTEALVHVPAVELGGDNECVWATSTAPPGTEASNGQVARYVFDVGDWDNSAWVVPHGVSGDPRSIHHLDQLADWAGGKLRPMRYSRSAVDEAIESTVTI